MQHDAEMRLRYANPHPLDPYSAGWIRRRCVDEQSYQTYNSVTTRAIEGLGCMLPGGLPRVYSASPRDWTHPAAGLPTMARQSGFAPFAQHDVSPFSSRDNSYSARLPIPLLSQRNDATAMVAMP